MAERKGTVRKSTRKKASGKSVKKREVKMLKVTLVRGLAGKRKSHVQAVRSLGLRRPGQSRILVDNPMVRGNIRKVGYLIKVEEVADETP